MRFQFRDVETACTVRCDFRQAEQGIVRCLRCPNWAYSDTPERVHARCRSVPDDGPPPRDPLGCIHLGAVVGELTAKECGCSGKTSLWSCDLHGECTPLAVVAGRQSCRAGQCGDYDAED